MRTTLDKGNMTMRPPPARDRPREPLVSDPKAAETIRGMLSECEDCMGEGRLEAASALSAAAVEMALRHGLDKLAGDAAVRFVITSIGMGRSEEADRAVALGWLAAEDVEYVSELFEEAEAAPSLPQATPHQARVPGRPTIAELKEEILGLVAELKARALRDADFF
jgi:hypothetical protein